MTIFWHGTSSAHWHKIKDEGLLALPPSSNFLLNECSWDRPTSKSLPGIYAVQEIDYAKSYSDLSIRKYGGKNLLISLSLRKEDIIPDEDIFQFDSVNKEILLYLNMSSDTDGMAEFYKKWHKNPKFRKIALEAIIEITHNWKFRANKNHEPNINLLSNLVLADIERMMSHLSNNEILMKMMGRKPHPVNRKSIYTAENNFLSIQDQVTREYQYHAFSNINKRRSVRIPFDISFNGDCFITSAFEIDDKNYNNIFGNDYEAEYLINNYNNKLSEMSLS